MCRQGVDRLALTPQTRTMQVTRRESARITLHGNAEFEASDVTLAGDCEFDVPAGQRMRVVAGQGGRPRVSRGSE